MRERAASRYSTARGQLLPWRRRAPRLPALLAAAPGLAGICTVAHVRHGTAAELCDEIDKKQTEEQQEWLYLLAR